jgi:hypothetical protein
MDLQPAPQELIVPMARKKNLRLPGSALFPWGLAQVSQLCLAQVSMVRKKNLRHRPGLALFPWGLAQVSQLRLVQVCQQCLAQGYYLIRREVRPAVQWEKIVKMVQMARKERRQCPMMVLELRLREEW